MSDRLTTVATYHDPVAAALAKNFLEAEGIPAALIDESTVATDWMLAGAIGGIKLQVAPIHIERAEMLLAQIQEDKDDAVAQEDSLSARTAVATQEIAEEIQAEREDRAPINLLADRVFRVAVFGLILLPLQIYALYLLFQLMGAEGTVSPERRWKVWVAALITIPAMIVFPFVILSCCSLPLIPL